MRPSLALVPAVVLAATAVLAQQPALKRTVLAKTDLSVPGREALTARVELPPGSSSGRHTHPGEELGYVLEGTVTLQIGDGGTLTLTPGATFVVPAGTEHLGTNPGKAPAVILSTFVVEKGKPLATPVK